MRFVIAKTCDPRGGFLFEFMVVGLLLLLPTLGYAAPGDLDPTFGDHGIVNTLYTYPVQLYFASGMAIQPDGKIIAVGEGATGSTWDFAVVHYNTDGTLDSSFGSGGIVITPVGSSHDGAFAVAIQQDGKVVAAGYSYGGGIAVVRYNTNGTLDTSFNGTGIVTTSAGSLAQSVAIQPNGKIVVASRLNNNFGVLRYNTDGTLDNTFGGTGMVITQVGDSNSSANSVAIQADGKIVVAGRCQNGGLSAFAIVRYDTRGELDRAFYATGKRIISVGDSDSGAGAVAIQRDGGIVAAGLTGNYQTGDFAIVRCKPNGELDTSFGGTGKVVIPVGDSGDYANSLAIQSDEKIIVAGASFINLGSEFALVRVNSDGSLDTTFNGTGKVVTTTVGNEASSVAIQADGKIVAAGGFNDEVYGFVLVRYQGGPVQTNRKIAFTSDRDGNREIYVMNSDGTSPKRLTNNGIVDDHPTWSPDGRRIAFLSQRAAGDYAIFVMNSDGTGRTEITPVAYQLLWTWNGWDAWSMSWSPDGQQLVFSNGSVNASTIVVVNSDGTGRRDLFAGYGPAWSPDGSKILFLRLPLSGNNNHRILTMRPDGTGHPQDITPVLSGTFVSGSPPVWSPDGLRFAFSSFDGANQAIHIANADGSDPQYFVEGCAELIPQGCSATSLPAWSPDGKTIAFINSGFESGLEIYVKDIGDEAIIRLTDSAGRNSNPNWQPLRSQRTPFDFDGDGRSDISVFRSADSVWYLDQSQAGFSAAQFGLSTDKITPADYDGDGKTDIGVYRNGSWYWLNSFDGSFRAFQFGLAGDIPLPADFTGDGRAELAVYRDGTWWIVDLSANDVRSAQFGLSTDKPVLADYDGDGETDLAVFRPSTGYWYISRSSDNSVVYYSFGVDGDIPLGGDFNGDGRSDLAVFRPSNGTWYITRPTGVPGQNFDAIQFGISADIPVPADYDGDGKTDVAIYRDGLWFLLQSSSAGFTAVQFGSAGDQPVPSAFVPVAE